MGDSKIDNKNVDAFSVYQQNLTLVKTHADQQGIPVSITLPVTPGDNSVSSYDLSRAPLTVRMGKITGATFSESPLAQVTTKSATYTLEMLSGVNCTLTLTASVYANGEVINGANSFCKSQDGAVFSSLTAELAQDVGQAFDALRNSTGSQEQEVVLVARQDEPSMGRRGNSYLIPESSYNSLSSTGSDRKK